MPSNRILDALLREETRKLSLHLPRERKTLERLLHEETPSVRAADGSEIILDRKSLEKLASLVPSFLHASVHLPVVVLGRFDLGNSEFAVIGDNVEQFIVSKLLGMTDLAFERATESREITYLYRPQIAWLVREFHSLFIIGFGTSDKRSSFFNQS